jgi:branched-chain amino acid transport system ATP-binding protein
MTFFAAGEITINFGGIRAVDGVSFTVEQGQVFTIIGPNGAGKTTIFNLVSRIYDPSGGRLIFCDEDITRVPPHEIARRGIARTFQNTEVFRRLSARDNVLIGLHGRLRGGVLGGALNAPGVRDEERAARVRADQLLERLGLAAVADVDAGSLPLGLQKRLEIARALAAEPRLLLLDEPAAGMNPTETRELMRDIVRIRDQGVTILLIEHDMGLVRGVCGRVVALDHGTKIAEGTFETVRDTPEVLEAYLGRRGGRA